ncbi:MAG: cytochrome c oxidase subunit 3 [Terriglobia bacterium]
MATALRRKPGLAVPPGPDNSGRSGSGGPGDKGFGGGDPFEPLGWSVPPGAYRAGMWVALASIVMFFGGLSSALLVRKGASPEWVRFALPRVLYGNTAALLLSSVTFEFSRKWLKAGMGRRFRIWLSLTLALGLIFIAGQLVAWKELQTSGVYLTSNPSGSFFYLLTAAHGLHLLGGIIALVYLVTQAKYIALGIKRHTALDVTAIYWHFMDGLWIYLFVLLVWKS